ncbi:MAG: hypothetical protein ABI151_13515 [Chitinophagaceae bacterium]
MELDELKNQWKQTDKIQKLKNQNIMELIQNKSYGPIAELKWCFKKQIIGMTVLPIALIAANLENIDKIFSSALFWFFILFCISVIIFARFNYAVVKKMEGMDGKVKSNLEQLIVILETRTRQKLIGIHIAFLLFIVLLEILPYFQNFRMLNKWHSLSPFIRFGAYAALLLYQYFISRMVSRRRSEKHIVNLKELVKQMQ